MNIQTQKRAYMQKLFLVQLRPFFSTEIEGYWIAVFCPENCFKFGFQIIICSLPTEYGRNDMLLADKSRKS